MVFGAIEIEQIAIVSNKASAERTLSIFIVWCRLSNRVYHWWNVIAFFIVSTIFPDIFPLFIVNFYLFPTLARLLNARWKSRMLAWFESSDSHTFMSECLARENRATAFWWLAPAFQLLHLTWFMALTACRVSKGLYFSG